MADAHPLPTDHRFQDLTGLKCFHLTVTAYAGRTERGKRHIWRCICECGKEAIVQGNHLKSKAQKSCGCAKSGLVSAARTGHGLTKSPEYRIWSGIITRCCNPKVKCYANYGGRGIMICERWRNSFENFLADVGPKPSAKHSIDRINNSGNYEPGNVRWTTILTQANNRRGNHLLTHDNQTHSISEWSRILGFRNGIILHRITKAGWSVEKALTTPPQKKQ